MNGPEETSLNPLILVLGASLALSFMRLPWLRSAKRDDHESLRTRWIYFEWSHPLLASALIRGAAVAGLFALAIGAWKAWPVLRSPDPLRSIHGALAPQPRLRPSRSA